MGYEGTYSYRLQETRYALIDIKRNLFFMSGYFFKFVKFSIHVMGTVSCFDPIVMKLHIATYVKLNFKKILFMTI